MFVVVHNEEPDLGTASENVGCQKLDLHTTQVELGTVVEKEPDCCNSAEDWRYSVHIHCCYCSDGMVVIDSLLVVVNHLCPDLNPGHPYHLFHLYHLYLLDYRIEQVHFLVQMMLLLEEAEEAVGMKSPPFLDVETRQRPYSILGEANSLKRMTRYSEPRKIMSCKTKDQ